jgi:hypothetical protein
MQYIGDPRLAVKIDVEIVVFMFHFDCERKPLGTIDDIGGNLENSTF